nr:MAG TPA: hypothetical protein [Bacteriophage sp.]
MSIERRKIVTRVFSSILREKKAPEGWPRLLPGHASR